LYVAHVFRRSFSSQGSSTPVSTFLLGLMPARAHNSWKRAFGRGVQPALEILALRAVRPVAWKPEDILLADGPEYR
jgi:hypothetical protein